MDITKDELLLNEEEYFERIRDGAVFIHPTDTIYGLGCSALHKTAVNRIRQLKNRPTQPFSVICPGKSWIRNHADIPDDWLAKLPGPYTFVAELKEDVLASNVSPDMQGMRLPDHWFTEFVQDLGIPVITTSANKTGENYMTSMEDLDPDIKQAVDFIIYEGEKVGNPSTVVIFKDKVEVLRR